MQATKFIMMGLVLVGCGESSENPRAATSSLSSSSSATSTSNGGGGVGGESSNGGMGGSGSNSGGMGSSGSGGSGGSGGSAGAGGGLGAEYCPEPIPGVDVGYAVGNQLADIVVKDCDGNDYSLQALCGAKALHIFASHGWCPLCQSFSGKQEMLHDEYAAQGLASVNIVLEKASGAPPDADYCKLWRDQFGLSDVVTLYDPTGAAKVLWSNTSSLSAFISADRVIVSKLEHDANVTTIRTRIEEVLAK